MKSRAAVAFAPGKPLEIVEIDVEPPRKGEVLVKITHTGVCHTDALPCPVMIRKVCSRQYWVMKVRVLLWKSAEGSQCETWRSCYSALHGRMRRVSVL
jgi:hypothetical protein